MSPPSLCGYNVSLSTFEAASHCIHSGICDLLPPPSDLGVEASIVWYMSYADPPPRRGDPLMELEAASSRCPCSTLILRTWITRPTRLSATFGRSMETNRVKSVGENADEYSRIFACVRACVREGLSE